jgi:hypothetical protein
MTMIIPAPPQPLFQITAHLSELYTPPPQSQCASRVVDDDVRWEAGGGGGRQCQGAGVHCHLLGSSS